MYRAMTKRMATLGLVMLAGCASKDTVRQVEYSKWSLETTPLDRSASQLSNQTAEHLAWARAYHSRIIEVDGTRAVENTLVPYNEMMMHLDSALWEAYLLARVHPDKAVREEAERAEREVSGYLGELLTDRSLYEAFRTLDIARAGAPTRYLVFKLLRSLRRAGADRSAAARERIVELKAEIAQLTGEFEDNIRNDEREIFLDSPADLAGLPDGWITGPRAAEDGRIRITTGVEDYDSFMAYAHSGEARRRLYEQFKSRGYPANVEVLGGLLAKRQELARLLGYRTWADYITEDKMVGSAVNAWSFIDRVSEVSRAVADREYEILLERKRQDAPGATKVEDWEKTYYTQLVKAERYGLEPGEERPYFNFPEVLDGLFELTGRMFGITYRQVLGLRLWHADVTAWDVYDGDERLGRFFLDPYRRAHKHSDTIQFDYRTGVAGVRPPQAVLVCDFANPLDTTTGVSLMDHAEVVALFHEFGHLLHTLFAGHQRWIGNAGISTEWEFIEAPAQLFEEWCYDVRALQEFAKHCQTGEPIPTGMVEKLGAGRDFGRGLHTAQQAFYAAVALAYHDRNPTDLDTTALLVDLHEKYAPFDYVDGTHFQCGFDHLGHYCALYYSYLWSLAVQRDLLTGFQEDGLVDPRTWRRFRDTIMTPGGSRRACDLMRGFLGRPHSPAAFERWLSQS